MEVILASQSPRRIELLKKIIKDFKVIPANVDEKYDKSLDPDDVVMYLAKLKATSIAKDNKDALVIGADTVVYIEGKILGKPKDKEDCKKMIKMLSGKIHDVYTGICTVEHGNIRCFYQKTEVTFNGMSDDEIEKYANNDEPYDKAGAYAIQGIASLFIDSIEGDYFNVMGMPINILYNHIKMIDKNIITGI